MTSRMLVRGVIRVAVSVPLVCAVSAGVARSATQSAITLCQTKGIQKGALTFQTAIQNLVKTCRKKVVVNGTLPGTTDCAGDVATELDGATVTTTYKGAVYNKLRNLEKKLLKFCSGEDLAAGTADDVGPTDLDDAGSGLRFHPWGAQLDEEANFKVTTDTADLAQKGVDLSALPTSATSNVESILESDCIALDPPAVWLARPPIVRLMQSYTCLMINNALAQVREEYHLPAPQISLVKARVIPIGPTGLNVPIDAGSDFRTGTSTLGPDGQNDVPNVPMLNNCATPGVGVCLEDLLTPCTLPSGSPGASSANCTSGVCVTGLLGPGYFGYSPADIPVGRLESGKCIFKLARNTDQTQAAEVKCLVDGVHDGSNTLVTTNSAGTCEGGPNDAQSCNSNADCDAAGVVPPGYNCISGTPDEYGCEVEGLSGSNRDNSPACGPCLIAKVTGTAGTGCGASASATCLIGTCSGGDRGGQACEGTSGVTLDCPGGSCNLGVSPFNLTGDEVGVYSPAESGMTYFLCPTLLRFDLPMEIVNGSGWGVADLSDAPRYLCLPGGVAMQTTGCFIREPGVAYPPLSVTSFYTQPTALPGNACPDVSLPTRSTDTGLPTRTFVGPIIGAAGMTAP